MKRKVHLAILAKINTLHFFTTDYVSVTALQFLGVIVHVVSDILF